MNENRLCDNKHGCKPKKMEIKDGAYGNQAENNVRRVTFGLVIMIRR